MSKHGLINVTFTGFLLALFMVSLLYAPHGNGVAQAASRSKCGAWSVVPSPSPGSINNALRSVATISASDVWTVGSQISNTTPQTLIEQWNGKVWKVISSPNASSSDNELFGVAADSTSDVWAVGLYSPSGSKTFQTLIEQWNGTTWIVVPSPNPGTFSALFSVVALSSNNVWAAGNYSSSGPPKTLIEHWDGSSWSVVNSPNVKALDNSLSSVTATSARDLWAVGTAFNPSSNIAQTLTEHYNGSRWSIVKSANVASVNILQGVTAVSSKLVWAVGYSFDNVGSVQTLIEQWNGSTWMIVSSPDPSSMFNDLQGVAQVAGSNQVWAVGYSGTNPGKTLAEFFC